MNFNARYQDRIARHLVHRHDAQTVARLRKSRQRQQGQRYY
jgi:hypothetical protein